MGSTLLSRTFALRICPHPLIPRGSKKGGSLPEVMSRIPRHAPACRGLTPDLAPAVPHDGAARCVPTSSWPQGTVQSRVSLNSFKLTVLFSPVPLITSPIKGSSSRL